MKNNKNASITRQILKLQNIYILRKIHCFNPHLWIRILAVVFLSIILNSYCNLNMCKNKKSGIIFIHQFRILFWLNIGFEMWYFNLCWELRYQKLFEKLTQSNSVLKGVLFKCLMPYWTKIILCKADTVA